MLETGTLDRFDMEKLSLEISRLEVEQLDLIRDRRAVYWGGVAGVLLVAVVAPRWLGWWGQSEGYILSGFLAVLIGIVDYSKRNRLSQIQDRIFDLSFRLPADYYNPIS